MTLEYKHVILADGLFPSSDRVLNILRNAEIIVCCDGSAQKLFDFGIEPHYIVGDLDSLSPGFKKKFEQRVVYSSNQETNDLTKAFEFCLSKGWDKVAILGATGLREDHTLGNISLLSDYKKKGKDVVMLSDYGIFIPIVETTAFDSFPGQKISIFSMNPETELTFEGLKYPVVKQAFKSLWQGTLNTAEKNHFKIILHQKGEVLIYISFD